MTTAIIETFGLCKRYGGSLGIDDVTLTIRRGEVFGFLGPNGAGKTTTIRTLLDLLHPSGGSARLFGLDSHRDSRAIHARLGNLPGEFVYDDRMTGRELLRLHAGVRGMKDLGRAEDLAKRFEADLDRPLRALSRGNRPALAAGLVHRPGTVTAIGAGTMVATYLLDVAGKLAGAIEPLRAASPFRRYGAAIQDGLDVTHMAGLTIVAIALAAAGAQLLERRDVL